MIIITAVHAMLDKVRISDACTKHCCHHSQTGGMLLNAAQCGLPIYKYTAIRVGQFELLIDGSSKFRAKFKCH